MYTFYKCRKCSSEFVLVDVTSYIGTGIKVTCPCCRSPRVKIGNESEDLRDCMTADSHTRHNGAIKQKTWKR